MTRFINNGCHINSMSKVEESVLVQVFGDDPFIKILDTMMDRPTHDYNKKELAEVNDISRQTLYNIWEKVEELNLVKETRKIGNTQLYRLNQDSPIVKYIVEFEKSLQEEKVEVLK